MTNWRAHRIIKKTVRKKGTEIVDQWNEKQKVLSFSNGWQIFGKGKIVYVWVNNLFEWKFYSLKECPFGYKKTIAKTCLNILKND